MPKLRHIRFKVTGPSRFPVDMLRYDQCFPYEESDSYKIHGRSGPLADDDGGVQEPITLLRISDNTSWKPTEGRWASFGWRVIGWEVIR